MTNNIPKDPQSEFKWKPKGYIWWISAYLLIIMGLCVYAFIVMHCNTSINLTLLGCFSISGIGGCLYCLRAIYLQACVKKEWDENWLVWYLLRPIISIIIGGISYLFIKSGLILFTTTDKYELNQLTVWVFAFLSGLNVDNFMKKIESVGETIWGINSSRTTSNRDQGDKK